MEKAKVKTISIKRQVKNMNIKDGAIHAGVPCAFTKKCDRFIEGVCPTEKNLKSNGFKCGIAVVKAEALLAKK